MQFSTIAASAIAFTLAAAIPQTPSSYATPSYTNTTAVIPPSYNGTTTNSTSSPSGTPAPNPGFSQQISGAGKMIGSSMGVLGAVVVGGVVLAL